MKFKFLFPVFLFISTFLAAQDYAAAIEEHRAHYKKDFLENERSPLQTQEALTYLRFFEANEKYKVIATFEATPDAAAFKMGTFSGIDKPYVQYGWLNFKIAGKSLRLAVYQSLKMRMMPQYKEHLFLPFKDLTNGDSSYGGGRYIDLEISEIKDGKVELDFNKSYNPWCHYSDGFSCPIPPTENHLKVEIEAGEKNYAKSKY